MPEISITEFVGNASQITEQVSRNGQPVIICGSNLADLILMTRADYEKQHANSDFFDRLCVTLEERVVEANKNPGYISHDTILQKAKDIVGEGYRKAHV
jgi:hypothetical protein